MSGSVQRILIANAKGGCGKSTVATNLASFYAAQGIGTALFDYDDQRSSTRWLSRRPSDKPAIHGVDASATSCLNVTRTWLLRVPENVERIIIDTPAGRKGDELIRQTKDINCIIVPVLPSPIDIQATADFIRDLLLLCKVRERHIKLAIIANRTRTNTLSFKALEKFLATLKIPVIARLRDTQQYTRAVEQGCGVHEIKSSHASRDVAHWNLLLNWLEAENNNQSEQTTHNHAQACIHT
ncbi:MAG TPA: ParA family protein [Gammaproteobacteria bacterium]|nr:ParA family protein [Gammaproteobacteria bacterium]